MDINSLLKSIFADKFEIDEREHQLFISVPYVGTFGLTAFDPAFWLQAFAWFMVQAVINVTVAVIIYTFIVKQQGSVSSFLVGYGCICPLLVFIPFRIIEALDLRNITFMLCAAGATPSLLLFRCLEAMHGTLPSFANQSLWNFILYYASTLQFVFDPKTEKPLPLTRGELASRAVSFVSLFVQTTLLYSLLLPYNYSPLPSREIQGLLDLFYWGNLGNNYLMAYLTGIALESGTTGLGILTSLVSGMRTMEINHSPLTKSTSPSDFWAQRWDRIVAGGLKRGVFRPLRQCGLSRPFAVLGTFVVSGLLHEYVLVIMAMRGRMATFHHTDEPYSPTLGKQLSFFLWNGIVVLLEHLVKGHPLFEWMHRNLPAPVRTALVLMTVMPIAFLFTDEYVGCGFYTDISMGFPRLILERPAI